MGLDLTSKPKNIKYSNGSLLFATVHNIINPAYKPPKQVRVDFFSQSIPVKKEITVYNLLPSKSAHWYTITQNMQKKIPHKDLTIFIFDHILFTALFSNRKRKLQLYGTIWF